MIFNKTGIKIILEQSVKYECHKFLGYECIKKNPFQIIISQFCNKIIPVKCELNLEIIDANGVWK